MATDCMLPWSKSIIAIDEGHATNLQLVRPGSSALAIRRKHESMNRAEKRRQKKSAEKAAKHAGKKNQNAKPVILTNFFSESRTLTVQEAIDFAFEHHSAGRLTEAESVYKHILEVNPEQHIALHLLGVIAYQVGNDAAAIDLMSRALAVKPDYAEAQSNFGNALQRQGRLDEAAASYQKAISILPNFSQAHNNLGNVFLELGKFDKAVESYQKALAIEPGYGEAHMGLGNAFLCKGDAEKAFDSHCRAVALVPGNELYWACLTASLERRIFTAVDDGLWKVLSLLMERPSLRPSGIVGPIIRVLRLHPDFMQILSATNAGEPLSETTFADAVARLSSIPVFLRLMTLTPIHDIDVEQMLATLRRSILEKVATGEMGEECLPFMAALALHCFTNEFVFSESDEERVAVECLQTRIALLMKEKADVPAAFIVTLGAYRPLHKFSWADELRHLKWNSHVAELIERQILEPVAELNLRSKIHRLTPIKDAVSQSVQQQYEENPYPRWVKNGFIDKGRTIGAVLRGAPFHFDIGEYSSPETPDILVAGCGTGQHALNTAAKFLNARVLAVDLSLSSLSYAMRKTDELGVKNIEYNQADIMELDSLDRSFDVIECGGVLHHLGDPFAGWQKLVGLLRDGGLMKIGLYSESARQCVVDGRAMIAERGYTASAEDIRKCRQEIIEKVKGGNLKMAEIIRFRDFFSLSECRDLLFHVQEHRFTLMQVDEALAALRLKFIGFEISDPDTLRKIDEAGAAGRRPVSLHEWHKFELENPGTFSNMYHFWCQKT